MPKLLLKYYYNNIINAIITIGTIVFLTFTKLDIKFKNSYIIVFYTKSDISCFSFILQLPFFKQNPLLEAHGKSDY